MNSNFGELLGIALQAKGISLTEFSNLLNLSRQAVYDYLKGESLPSPDTISRICQILELEFSYFNNCVDCLSDIKPYYRSFKKSLKKHKDMAEAHCKILTFVYKVISEHVDIPNINIFSRDKTPGKYSLEEIENAALELRMLWGLGVEPIGNLTNTMEKNGIVAAKKIFGDGDIDAFSFKYDDRLFVFLSSYEKPSVRIRFSNAHELGHMVLHSHYEDRLDDSRIHDEMEKEANSFAACFLMPKIKFKREIISDKLKYLLELKKKWMVSVQAIILRARDLEVFDDEDVERLYMQIGSRGWRTLEPLDDKIKNENPLLLKESIQLIEREKMINKEDIFSLIGYSSFDLSRLLGFQ